MLAQILSSFSCEIDPDIENFIRNRAVEFESLSKARTYLICDEDLLKNEGKIFILGYISLALKVLQIPDGVSINARKDLDGYRGKIHGAPITDIPCYLIGQLARNDHADKALLSGEELIEEAHRIIMSSVEAVGGRFVMIECHDKPKLLQFYRDNGFKEISRIADKDIPMVQMLCKLID